MTMAGKEDVIGDIFLWGTQVAFFIVVSYMVIKKKGMFESLGREGENPWNFGGWFLGMWFFATCVGFVVAIAWPAFLGLGSIYLFGALLIALRKRYGGTDELDYEDKSGPD